MRWGRFIVAALALAGLAPASAEAADRTPVSPSAAWAPNADDSWLFDVRSGQYRLGDGVRGYQTPQGICVDLGDVVLALDLAETGRAHVCTTVTNAQLVCRLLLAKKNKQPQY